jgi:hypothetical protein
MLQDDPGDSMLALSIRLHFKQPNETDFCLILADAIRLHITNATPEQAQCAAGVALERLLETGFEIRRR